MLWMEQDRLVSPSTLATNYAITGTFITAWSANEQNGVREKKSMAKKGCSLESRDKSSSLVR